MNKLKSTSAHDRIQETVKVIVVQSDATKFHSIFYDCKVTKNQTDNLPNSLIACIVLEIFNNF